MLSFTCHLPAQERNAVEMVTNEFSLGETEIPFQRRELYFMCVHFDPNE